MKFLHISDLHIGKKFRETDFTEDQIYILNEIIRIVDDIKPDGIFIAGDIYDNIVEGVEPEQIINKYKQKNQNVLGVLLSDAKTGSYYGEGSAWLYSPSEKFAEIISTNRFEVGDYCYRTSMTVTAGVEEQLLAQGFAYKTTEAYALEIDGYAYGVCFIDRTYGKIAFWLGGVIWPELSQDMHAGVVYPFTLIVQDIHDRINEIEKADTAPEPDPRPMLSNANPATAKPVIYLYPEQPTEVSVKLGYPKEDFTYTYPAYNDGWHVLAQPDGRLTNLADNTEHYYLFWEGNKKVDWNLSQGFIVKGSDTELFLRDKLSFMGLTPREYNDFITFWVPEMKNNPYNLISFSFAQYEQLAPLDITPKPDSILRVHMVYKRLTQPVDIAAQTLIPWQRKGFAVVEWGGSRA